MHRGGRASTHLDLLRGVSALVVCLGHVRQYFLVDSRSDFSRAAALIYFTTGFGHQAVMVFFVLSGFFIAGSVLDARRADRWSWRAYLLARATRLYVVLLPALLLGALLDGLGMAILHRDGFADGFAPRYTWGAFLANALFLQGVRGIPFFGSNGPLWSLSYEAWYYLLWPLLVVAVMGPAPLRTRILAFAAGTLALVLVGPKFTSYFLVWLLGAALHLVRRPSRGLSLAATAAGLLGLAGTLTLIGRDAHRAGFVWDFTVALATALVVLGLVSRDEPLQAPTFYSRTTAQLAGFSYTLYLVHYPAIVLCSMLAFPSLEARWQPDTGHLLRAACVAIGVIAYAWGIARFTEARTERARKWIWSWLTQRRKAAPANR